MKFEKQQQNTNDYTDWNSYQWSLFEGKETAATKKDGEVIPDTFIKTKKVVGIPRVIVDCGLQPQLDSSYEWKGEKGTGDSPEGYSEEEKSHVAKYPTNYFKTVDGKRMQFKPERPTQEVAIYIDFPKVLVDWAKHPVEQVQHLGEQPLRICLNGYFKNNKTSFEGFGKKLKFDPHWKTGKLSPNSPVSKLAKSLGVEDKFENSDYDFDTFGDGAAMFEVVCRKSNGYVEFSIKGHTEIIDVEAGDTVITREQQIPNIETSFKTIMTNESSYEEDIIGWVNSKRELKAVLPKMVSFQPNSEKAPDFWLGCNWEDTALCKAMSKTTTPKENTSQEKAPAKEETKPEKKVESKANNPMEPPIDFDDD